MTIRKLATLLAKLEGKKSQARIGDLREVLSILSDMVYESSEAMDALFNNGEKRFKKAKKKLSKR